MWKMQQFAQYRNISEQDILAAATVERDPTTSDVKSPFGAPQNQESKKRRIIEVYSPKVTDMEQQEANGPRGSEERHYVMKKMYEQTFGQQC